MVDGGKLPSDADSPTLPGAKHPRGHEADVSAGTQTPPPSSSEMTMGDVMAASNRAPSPAPISDSALGLAQLFPPGTLLGARYRILRVLGEGGMGAVYQARDQELDRLIALKVIRPELAGNPAILQRFKQELILARNVTHRNVVRIFDLGEADGIKFITMEYVDGEDLRAILKREGKFTPRDAVHVIEQVCRALEVAHAEGVIHRDLKPQNIMRDSQGRIVVMDFGLARSLDASGMTQTGALVGTLEYMSPEQALGTELDQRSDLFTVGLIFYELLSGKMPYKADTALASLMKRTQERAAPVSSIDGSVPKALSNIVARCLERDPKMRYHSAREILQQLEAWDANPTIAPSDLARMAPAPSRSVQISLPVPEGRGWRFAAVAAVLLLILLAVPATRNLVFHGHTHVEKADGIPDLSKGKYLAVLPFRILGDQKALEYVGEGVAEALSAKLFQLQEVHLASPAAAEKFANTDQPLDKVARALGVNLILQGAIQGSSDKLRITLALQNISTGERVWTQEFSGVPQDLLTLEDQAYTSLATALELKPTNDEVARVSTHPTENVTAYDMYLQGRTLLHGNHGPQDAQTAVRFFDSALNNDKNFALAYTGIADASLRMFKDTKDGMWAQKALLAAQQAEQLNPNLAEVHLSLGSVYSATGKSNEAVDELKRALALAPNSDEAYRRLGDAYKASGRKQEALTAYQSAVHANPYYWYNHNSLGSAYLQFGDADKALQEYQRVTEISPDNATGYANIGATYFRQAKWAEAIPSFQKALAIQADADIYSNLGTAYFFLGRYDDAVKNFEQAVALSPKNEQLMGNLGDAYRASGRSQEAASTYEKAIQLAYAQLQVNPRDATTMADLAFYYAKKGDATQAQQYIRQARSIDASDLQLIYEEGQIYALSGKESEAMRALREAFQKGYPSEEAEKDPELASLKSSAQFGKLIAEYQKKSK
ncbi:MAG TPA: tetratricopeptide repeat protein [Terriglobales bacterium]|nr:tetratricopeptide repeat protein [Terriglobales bacterium]